MALLIIILIVVGIAVPVIYLLTAWNRVKSGRDVTTLTPMFGTRGIYTKATLDGHMKGDVTGTFPNTIRFGDVVISQNLKSVLNAFDVTVGKVKYRVKRKLNLSKGAYDIESATGKRLASLDYSILSRYYRFKDVQNAVIGGFRRTSTLPLTRYEIAYDKKHELHKVMLATGIILSYMD